MELHLLLHIPIAGRRVDELSQSPEQPVVTEPHVMLPVRRPQNSCDRARQTCPAFALGMSLAPPFSGEPVELGFPVVLGDAPVGIDEPLLLEPIERGIERPFFNA
jgi:hypothetical protein